MQVRVTWPSGKKRMIFVTTLRDLDRFVGWQVDHGHRVDLKPDREGLWLAVLD